MKNTMKKLSEMCANEDSVRVVGDSTPEVYY